MKKILRDYQITFEPYGLLLFLAVMAPNFFWFAVPAPKDVLRQDSVTPVLDGAASVLQALLAAALCLLKNHNAEKLTWRRPLILGSTACYLCYGIAWFCYYREVTGPMVILSLLLFPCGVFFLFSLDRKNIPAAIVTVLFTSCHMVYGIINFLL